MNDLAVGRVFRRLRHRLAWRQAEVAKRAGISITTYSDAERGQIARMSLATLRRIANALEVDLHLEARWRGGSLDRVLAGRHAEMSEWLAAQLTAMGWEVRPEVSFNHFGERGIVDLVAWHAPTRTLLLIELKTELTDINALLGTNDRRRRLAALIAESCGWAPAVVAQWLVVAEGRTNRRRVAEHRTVLRSAFPHDGRAVRGWLARPSGALNALWFLPDSAASGRGRSRAPRIRVRAPQSSVATPDIHAGSRGSQNLAILPPSNRA